MRNFDPYDIDFDSIPESKPITDPSHLLRLKISAEINKIFDKMTTEEIVEKTSLNPSDISRIRIQSIKRFSIDRLIKILIQLDQTVSLTVKPKKTA